MRALSILSTALLLLLIDTPAWAWGPAAHLDLGLAVLGDLALVAPAVAALLRRHADDFLYGSLAADITIGKNLSPYQLHCHNWQVALPVLELAERDATRAFAWGYLSHLAADTVAHNYFVPYKTVEHFALRGAAHTYWELRFDAHVPQAAWQAGRRLSMRAFADHDRHLRKILTGPLFPFAINKQLFNSMLLFSRLRRWRKTAASHSRRTHRVLTVQEWQEARAMSLERVRVLLARGQAADCLRSDPTGHRNLLIATELRRRLRRLRRQQRLLEPETVGARFKPLFRDSIEAKLELPSLLELIDPDKPPATRRNHRGLLANGRPAAAGETGKPKTPEKAKKPKKANKVQKPKQPKRPKKPKKPKKPEKPRKAKKSKKPKQPEKASKPGDDGRRRSRGKDRG
jgi:hypothetical protein